MKDKPEMKACALSIVLDTETLQITGDILLDQRISLWQQAAQRIQPRTYELILCSNQELSQQLNLPEGVRLLVRPQAGYYALKNEGAKAARGEIVFWGDIDCRPDPDYFIHLLAYFQAQAALIVGGRSFYDGEDFPTRVNSATSFGYLQGIHQLGGQQTYLAHNVSVRRDATLDYFGPYTDRYGGDEFMTAAYRQAGEKLPVEQKLIIYHESPAHSFGGLLDRNLREIGRMAFISEGKSPSARQMFRTTRKIGRFKWRAFQAYGEKLAIAPQEKWKAQVLFAYYSLINHLATLRMLVFPRLLQKYLRYQFGDLQSARPVHAQVHATSAAAARIARQRARLTEDHSLAC